MTLNTSPTRLFSSHSTTHLHTSYLSDGASRNSNRSNISDNKPATDATTTKPTATTTTEKSDQKVEFAPYSNNNNNSNNSQCDLAPNITNNNNKPENKIKSNYNHRNSIDSYYYNLFQNPPNNNSNNNNKSPDLSRKFSYYRRMSITDKMNHNNYSSSNNSSSPDFEHVSPRHRIISQMVQSRRSEYETSEPFSIYCGTWNTNGQMPGKEEGVTYWLGQAKDSFHATPDFKKPDIYAFGFQELDLSKEAYIRQDSFYEKAWLEKIESSHDFLRSYDRLKCVRLVGIMLVIYRMLEKILKI